MHSQSILAPLSKSALILVALLAALIPIFVKQAQSNLELRQVRTDFVAEQLGRQIAHLIESRVAALELLAIVLPRLDVRTYEDYAVWASHVRKGVPGFFAINLTNAEGIVRWVEPLEPNESVIGKRLTDKAAEYIHAAGETGKTHLTHFLPLFQGPIGMAFYVPVYREGKLRGFLNGVFTIEEFFKDIVQVSSYGRFAIKVYSQSHPEFQFVYGESQDKVVGHHVFDLFGQPMVVEVRYMMPPPVLGFDEPLMLLIFAGVIVTSVLVSISSFLLMRSRQHLRKQLETERFQSALLNLLVHDILNPVLVVRYSIDAIKRHADSNLIKQLQKTYYGLDQLDAVIKRVKQLRALELGKAKLVREPVPVNDIISDTLHAFESRFQEKKLIADFRLAPQDAVIAVDRVIFQNNVINNIIANAIKFSEPGGRILMQATPKRDHVIIEISDQGIGMSPSMVAALFREDGEPSRPGTHGEAGTGIGMLQIKAYTRFFGGRVTVHSQTKASHPENHGTTVCLYMPHA